MSPDKPIKEGYLCTECQEHWATVREALQCAKKDKEKRAANGLTAEEELKK